MQIAIIDYDSGNIHSVKKALEYVAPNVDIIHTNNVNQINNADKIVFPGQGAIGNCMQKLQHYNLIDVIKKNAKEKYFLGICLGLQLLFNHSEEDSSVGLGIIDGDVVKFQTKFKIPHIGWNSVEQIDNPLWFNIANNSYFYSVHSYFVRPKNNKSIIGTSDYGNKFTTAIAKNNLIAVQFHPEKSSTAGLQLLKNFVSLN